MSRHTGEHDTIINPTTGNPTTTTKKQQPEIVETYRYPKGHQGRPKEKRGQIPTYRGSMCSLRGRINRSGTLVKAQ